jgi:hypothetical protein
VMVAHKRECGGSLVRIWLLIGETVAAALWERGGSIKRIWWLTVVRMWWLNKENMVAHYCENVSAQ